MGNALSRLNAPVQKATKVKIAQHQHAPITAIIEASAYRKTIVCAILAILVVYVNSLAALTFTTALTMDYALLRIRAAVIQDTLVICATKSFVRLTVTTGAHVFSRINANAIRDGLAMIVQRMFVQMAV
jgi:hypothetical protein